MLVSTIFLRRRTAGLPLLTLAAGAANVVSNVVLIPRLGIAGAAWSTLVGYVTLTALTWWYARRAYPIGLDLRRLALLAVGVPAAILLARMVRWEDAGLWLSTGYHLAVTAGFALVLVPLMLGPMNRLRAMLAAERAARRDEDRLQADRAAAAARPGAVTTMGHPEEHA
jgi:O-antigen/teichoic acid export membrane protein